MVDHVHTQTLELMTETITASGSTGSLADIVASLQDDIVVGRLAAGVHLVEEDIARRLSTKRHIVRQAFVELERYGLVERRPNHGASVRRLTLLDVTQIYAVREVLEVAAVHEMPLPLPTASIDAIVTAQRAHDSMVEQGDSSGVLRANFAFHTSLFNTCGNPYLAGIIDDFRRRTHVVWSYAIMRPEYFRTAQHQHWLMIEALRVGDREGLAKLCIEHLNISKGAFVEGARIRQHK